jgi:hypothetical protein
MFTPLLSSAGGKRALCEYCKGYRKFVCPDESKILRKKTVWRTGQPPLTGIMFVEK